MWIKIEENQTQTGIKNINGIERNEILQILSLFPESKAPGVTWFLYCLFRISRRPRYCVVFTLCNPTWVPFLSLAMKNIITKDKINTNSWRLGVVHVFKNMYELEEHNIERVTSWNGVGKLPWGRYSSQNVKNEPMLTRKGGRRKQQVESLAFEFLSEGQSLWDTNLQT